MSTCASNAISHEPIPLDFTPSLPILPSLAENATPVTPTASQQFELPIVSTPVLIPIVSSPGALPIDTNPVSSEAKLATTLGTAAESDVSPLPLSSSWVDELNSQCQLLEGQTEAEITTRTTLFVPIGEPDVNFTRPIPDLTDDYVASLAYAQGKKISPGKFIGILLSLLFTREEERKNRCTAFQSLVRGTTPPVYKRYGQLCSIRMGIIQRCVIALYPEFVTEYFNPDFSYKSLSKKVIHTRGQKTSY